MKYENTFVPHNTKGTSGQCFETSFNHRFGTLLKDVLEITEKQIKKTC